MRLRTFALAAIVVVAGTATARSQYVPARQVTTFGVLAVPGGKTVDPELASVEAQLRKLLPGHSFRLLGAANDRLITSGVSTCALAPDLAIKTELVRYLDAQGKVQLRVSLHSAGQPPVVAEVGTPPDQLFFLDKRRPDGNRLLIGVGAR